MKIDPKNPPDNAVKLPDGNFWYLDTAYDGKTGEPLGAGKVPGIPKSDSDRTISADGITGTGVFNPFSLLGVSNEDATAILTRGGLILLGAAIIIIGVAMLISGTKTAELVKSAIPVAGKVL